MYQPLSQISDDLRNGRNWSRPVVLYTFVKMKRILRKDHTFASSISKFCISVQQCNTAFNKKQNRGWFLFENIPRRPILKYLNLPRRGLKVYLIVVYLNENIPSRGKF